jgi:predicted ATPase
MLRHFALRDFKGHRDTQLELGRFTMLVGDNASGKTSVLDALVLQASFGHDPEAVLRDNRSVEDLRRRGTKGPISFRTEGVTGGRVRFDLQPGVTLSGMAPISWKLRVIMSQDGPERSSEISERIEGLDRHERQSTTVWDDAWTVVGSARRYCLSAEQIAVAAYSGEPDVQIAEDGTNTAVVLAAMKLGNNNEAFQRVEDALRQLIPAVERIHIRPATVSRSTPLGADEVVGSKLYFDFHGARGVPAHGASHGTLIALAMLAILHGERRSNLLLIDDFDHVLHPRAQMELVRMIKQLLTLDEFKGVQVVASTHSPYVLDELDPSEVQVFALRDDGTVASRRLSDHPEADKTRGMLKAGQLWSLDPERDWIL